METSSNISIIIPAYNCADTIGETIESIMDGNLDDGDEVIIIDDFSADNTLDIIRSYVDKYPFIQMLRHKINKGSAAAGRNTGIEQASNALFFCLDADNVLSPHSIQALKDYLVINQADAAAFGELWYFTEDIRQITHKWVFRDVITLSDALAGPNWPGPSGNYMFTRKSWLKAGRYEETLGGAYDSWAFGIKQLATGSKMVTLPGTYYFHRHGYQSAFVRDQGKMNSSLIALSILLKYIDKIKDEDIEYILSKEHRYSWFNEIDKRPIHLKDNFIGNNGLVIDNKDHSYRKYLQPKRYLNYIKYLINKIG